MVLATIRCFAVMAVVVAIAPALARADAKAVRQIEKKTAAAMESYDLMEFEAARRSLNEVVAFAESKGIDDPAVARAYLSLGIVYFSGMDDPDNAKLAFGEAVRIDPSIEIDVGYRTGELDALLAEARAMNGPDDAGGCDASGLEHSLVEQAAAGRARAIRARLGTDVKAPGGVRLYYRSQGEAEFESVDMQAGNGCEYVAEIPGDALRGEFLHYYVAAVNRRGRPVASKGSSGSPNIIEIGGAAAAGLDDDRENPLGSGGSVEKGVSGGVGDDDHSLFVSVAVGSGAGFVTGRTEAARNEVACCLAPAPLQVVPEIGYYLSKQTTASLAFRMGFPIGANVTGHATFAPAGLLRLRHALDEAGTGLFVTGAIGGGILRNTVKLDDGVEGMDTDTTAAGPFLLGGGVGYAASLGSSMSLVTELNALAGLTAGITELGSGPGSVRPNFGLQFDATLGLLFAF